MKEDKKLPDGFANYLVQQMAERRDRKNKLLSQGWNDHNKADNLNGGLPRQEYLDELEKARQDSYNHSATLSKGFCNWMTEQFNNQPEERQARVNEIRESFDQQLEEGRQVHPMDKMINEALRGERSGNYYRQRRNAERNLFPADEVEKRRSQIENNHHPMDAEMRQRLADREARKKA